MRASLVAVALAAAGAAYAQPAPPDYPSRPIKLVVSQAPGGAPDRIARFVAQTLAEGLGGNASVVVENRPGASGVIGTESVMRAPPDGYTLLLAGTTTHGMLPAVMPNVPYDPVKSFAPVANLYGTVKALWVNATLPVTNLAEFNAYVAARPGRLNYASGGVGSSNYIDMEMYRAAADLDIVHVPYNGPAAGIAAVASGDTQMMIVSVTGAAGAAQAGKVRPIAVFAHARSPLFPDVRTAGEQGAGNVDLTAWLGIVAPAGTPPAIVAKLSDVLMRTLRTPKAQAWAASEGLETILEGSDALAATIERDGQRWRDTIKRLGIVPR
ncbi:MAG: Bug family tripartite tricarboxylate transporter substrate binding protein [Vicinamibacteria bacterium]|jgi:tripartite-type tricarboxylate transporter receptor subunit TctC